MKIQFLDADYIIEEEEVEIRLFGKNSSGEDVKLADKDFKPYFYVVPGEETDVEQLKTEIRDEDFENDDKRLEVLEVVEENKKILNEERDVVKITTSIPANVPKLKDELWDFPGVKECREFSIPFYRRYLIDMGIRPGKWYEVEINNQESTENFEIAGRLEKIGSETDVEEDGLTKLAFDLEVYQDEIIMLSVCSNNLEKVYTTVEIDRDYVEVFNSEKEIIEKFKELVDEENYDFVIGYNTDEYDFQVLRERCEEHDITLSLGRNGERMKFNRRGRFSGARLKGRVHVDLYPYATHIMSPGLESETLDLDSLAEELLGENKDDMSWKEMKENWENKENLGEFADYALKDSKLTYKLGEEIVPQIQELSKITGLIPFDASRLTYGQLTENYLLRESHHRNMIAENRPSQRRRNERRREGAYEGGFVYEPEAGIYDNIVTLDFRSLYPTVMVSHNISPDTLNLPECEDRFEIEEFDYDFCQDEQGFFPDLIQDLIRSRYELKEKMQDLEENSGEYKRLDNRQQAQKILANSFYGYLGYSGARWYSKECAEATTYLGRKYIEDTIQKAEKQDYEVVYGDTDSVFLQRDNIREVMDEFLEEINNELPEFMELEFEGFFKTGFFTSVEGGGGAKKKYALMDEEGKMKITGFEQVRRDWSPIAKETQKQVLERILNKEPEEAAEIVKNRIEELKNQEIPLEKLKIYTTLTKKPENYDSTAPHVEAVKKAEKRGKEIEVGTTIAYVITKGPGTISDRAELLEYAENYDPHYYIEKQLLPASLRVLKEFGYTEGQLKGKGKQSGLSRFS